MQNYRLFIAVALAALISVTSTGAIVTNEFKGQSAFQWNKRYIKEHKALTKLGKKTRTIQGKLHKLAKAGPAFGRHYLEQNFLCIYGFENGGYGWTANTGNKYHGGLQMDMEFMKDYGAEYLKAFGTADKWPISVQIAVAIKAYLSGRGFYPWPNTARFCGLLGS